MDVSLDPCDFVREGTSFHSSNYETKSFRIFGRYVFTMWKLDVARLSAGLQNVMRS